VFTVSANNPTEDAFDCRDEGFFVLCDGHGGSEVAHHVAKNLWPEFKAQKQWLDVGDAFALSLRNLDAHFAVRQSMATTGSCVLACYIDGAKLYVANVGDCRAVLCRVDEEQQIKAVQLTTDHNVGNEEEMAAVKERSKDPSAVRPPLHASNSSIKRVAGTLLVTRALGDHYLKTKSISFAPFAQHVPYITGEPEVACYPLTSQDLFLIMATDGVWDMLTNLEAVSAVLGADERLPSEQLRRIWTQRVCEYHHMLEEDMERVPKGQTRRKVHDDATAIVITLNAPEEFFRPEGSASVEPQPAPAPRPPPRPKPQLQEPRPPPEDEPPSLISDIKTKVKIGVRSRRQRAEGTVSSWWQSAYTSARKAFIFVALAEVGNYRSRLFIVFL